MHRRLPPAGSSALYRRLFQDCFPETAGTSLETPEHYLWKFGTEGKDSPSCEFGAFADSERLVGYYAALPFRYKLAGSEVLAGLVCDVMTDSSMRGKGIFTAQGRYATAEMAKDGIAFCTGYPIRKEVFPGHLKVGWKIAFKLPVYFKLLDPVVALAGRTRAARWAGAAARPVCRMYQKSVRICGGAWSRAGTCRRFTAEEFFERPEYAAFHERWGIQYSHYLVRTSRFFRWRLSPPRATYTILAVYDRAELAGFAVVRNSAVAGMDVTAVVEFMVLPGRERNCRLLHRNLEVFCRESATAGIVILCTTPDATRWQLYRNGYVKSPVQFTLILKWLAASPEPVAFSDARAWHLTWVDTDNL